MVRKLLVAAALAIGFLGLLAALRALPDVRQVSFAPSSSTGVTYVAFDRDRTAQ